MDEETRAEDGIGGRVQAAGGKGREGERNQGNRHGSFGDPVVGTWGSLIPRQQQQRLPVCWGRTMRGMRFGHGRRVVDIALNDLGTGRQDLLRRRRGERCRPMDDGGARSELSRSENGTGGRLSKLSQAGHAQSGRRRHGCRCVCVWSTGSFKVENRGVSGDEGPRK